MRQHKLYLKRFISLFLTNMLLALPSTARITPWAFKGITHYFLPGQEFYSPTLGIAALESGLIYNLRFYGNFIAQYKQDGANQRVRDYIKDVSGNPPNVPPDPSWTLVKILFPSSGGDLATQTNSNHNFGKHVVSPTTIALLLNFAQQIRLTGQYISPLKEIFQNKDVETVNKSSPLLNKTPIHSNREKRIPDSIPFSLEKFSVYVKRHLITPTPEQISQIEAYKASLNKFLLTTPSPPQLKSFKQQHQIILTDKIQIEACLSILQTQKNQKEEKKIGDKKKENRKDSLTYLVDDIFKSLDVTSMTETGNLKENIQEILETINKSIAQEKTTLLYPKYTTEQVILAFFCEHFDTQEDIFKLLRALAVLDTDHSLMSNEKKVELNNASPTLLTEADLSIIPRKPNPNIDDFYALANSDIFQRIMPYKSGEQPVGNGNTQAYDRSNNKIIQNTTFADCVELMLRQLMNLTLYDPVLREFVLKYLESYVSTLNSPIINRYFQEIKSFYQHQSPLQANSGNIKIRSLWNRVVGDLNALDGEIPYNILYNAGETYQYNMEPGFINVVNVFRKLFDLQLPTPQSEKLTNLNLETANLEKKKEWIVAYFQAFFTLLNPTRSYELDTDNLREGKQQEHVEVFGNLGVIVKEKQSGEKLFSYIINLTHGHGDLINLKDRRTNYKQYPLPDTIALSFQENTALNSLKLLVPALQPQLTEILYRLYPRTLEGNKSAIAVLQTIADLVTQASPFIDDHFISSILANILDAISWDDNDTLRKIFPILIKLQPKFSAILKDHVKGFSSSEMSNETLQKILLEFPKIKFLYLDESELLEELSLSNLENLQVLTMESSNLKRLTLENVEQLTTLNLNNTPLSKIEGLENLKALKTLQLESTLNLQELHVAPLGNLKNLILSSSSITKIHGLENLTALKSLDLSKTKNLQELSLTNLKNLREFSLSGSSVTKVQGLENLTALKTLNLAKTQFLQEFLVSNFENLEDLYLSGSSISKLPGLEHLKALIILDLRNTRNLEELTLNNLSHLQTLNLSNSSVSKIEGLESLKDLKMLNLANTPNIENLFLSNCDNLQNISLGSSLVQKVYLRNLKSLKVLNLGNTNKLQELRLNNLESLQDITLTSFSVQKIYLENLNTLKKLNLRSAENVQELSVANLNRLQEIELSSSSQLRLPLANLPPSLKVIRK